MWAGEAKVKVILPSSSDHLLNCRLGNFPLYG